MNALKLFHVLFIFTWIGTLLSLTRLLAYQYREPVDVQLKCAKIYRRFYFSVDLPSMVIALVLAAHLVYFKDINWKAGWFHMKLLCGVLLVAADLICGYQVVKLCRAPTLSKGVFYKILHGLVGLLLIGILVAIYLLKPRM